MTRRRWTITTYASGKRRDVDLLIYDNLATMRGAATRWTRVTNEKVDFSGAAAVTHGFQRIRINANDTETEAPLVSKIRLTRDGLSPLVVSHEVAHAAQHIYGLDFDDGRPVGDHMDSGNENFAHLYGELFAAVWGCVTRYEEHR